MSARTVSAMKTIATINLIAGLWLFVSPWVYRASSVPSAWNSWVVGVLIVLFAWMQAASPEAERPATWCPRCCFTMSSSLKVVHRREELSP